MIRFVTHILDVLNVLGMQRIVPPTEYTIRFENYDGTVLQESQVQAGTTPVYSGATPTKPQDASYTYTFNGWLPYVDIVTGDQTYVAQFTAVPIPAPDPLHPANETVLKSHTNSVQFYPKFTDPSVQVQYTQGGVTQTDTLTLSNVLTTINADPDTDVIITGLTGITLQPGTTYFAISSGITNLNIAAAADLETIDFRNANDVPLISVFTSNIVNKIYHSGYNYSTASTVADIIMYSTINNGYVWLDTSGTYANIIINMANSEGWTVIDL